MPSQAQALPMAHLFSLPGACPRTPANPITLFYAKSLFLVQFLQNRMPCPCGPRALHSLGTSKVIIIISGGLIYIADTKVKVCSVTPIYLGQSLRLLCISLFTYLFHLHAAALFFFTPETCFISLLHHPVICLSWHYL